MGDMNNTAISIADLARLSGLSAYTLGYYETKGILRAVRRAPNGHRRYNREDVLWLEFVMRLKLTGMPLAEIKQYADLRSQGDKTLKQRMEMLRLHRERLAAQINALSACANALDDKIRVYRDMIANSLPSTRRNPK